jgi:hypothetical protein
MSDNPLDNIHDFDRVSVRAVVVYEGEDQSQALSEAGIFDPISLPVAFGENRPDVSFGDGITPNLTAVLETDQEADHPFDAPSNDEGPHALNHRPQRSVGTGQDEPRTASLSPAYGLQPLAPVRPRGHTRRISEGD